MKQLDLNQMEIVEGGQMTYCETLELIWLSSAYLWDPEFTFYFEETWQTNC